MDHYGQLHPFAFPTSAVPMNTTWTAANLGYGQQQEHNLARKAVHSRCCDRKDIGSFAVRENCKGRGNQNVEAGRCANTSFGSVYCIQNNNGDNWKGRCDDACYPKGPLIDLLIPYRGLTELGIDTSPSPTAAFQKPFHGFCDKCSRKRVHILS